MATIPEALKIALRHYETGQPRLAEQIYQQIINADPTQHEALNMLGIIAGQSGRRETAVDYFSRAVALEPSNPTYQFHHGVSYQELGRLEEAVGCYERALQIRPDSVPAYHNLANALNNLGRFDETIARSEAILRHDPNCIVAHDKLGITWLLRGEFEKGWPEYEWRLRRPECAMPPFAQPRWDGSPLEGRTILLQAEQGFGDTLQFIRYAELVKERGGRVIVGCPPSVAGLIGTNPAVDQVLISPINLPPFDVYIPLLSLPLIFGTNLDSIPAKTPYLSADQKLVDQWRDRLSASPGFKVGIFWQGNPKHRLDQSRSFQVEQFAPLAQVKNVRLFSLQKGHGSEQLAKLAGDWPLVDLGSQIPDDFGETAAVVKNLDLVICADTALAHLAGALGAPVWVALPFYPDWRWLLNREDSPWYPTLRLFRQKRSGDWSGVFEMIRDELKAATVKER